LGIQSVTQRFNKNTLSLIWAGAFADIFAFTILNPFLPRFYLDLGAPVAQIGLLLAVNAFIGFFSGILWGKLSDRYGRRPILLICRLGALVGYLILAFSTNIMMVVISRVVDGIFSRSILITLTAVGDVVSEEKRSEEMSKVGIPWITGGLIGPAIGGFLSVYGLIGIGLACASISLLTFLVTLFTFRETHSLVKQSDSGKHASFKTAPAGVFSLLKQHNPRVLLNLNFFTFLAHIIFVTTSTLYLTKKFELTVGQIGSLFTLIGSINLTVRLIIFPGVLRKIGDRNAFRIGLLAFLAAFAWLIFNTQIWEFVVISSLVSFGTTCSVDVMHGIMSRSVQRHEQGQMMGLNAMVESVSLVLGPIIGSFLLSFEFSGFYPMSAIFSSIIALVISFFPLRLITKNNAIITDS
jgi:DHA1 family tetracycline resistance protein-like MFS transporter